ncbi:menaquinone-dependent protoporphyrinogen IX dehydrogenase [Allomuricauda sp. SCSIO 65647]|uniref:menaquinone-dependent protoporphyrinogen IX dehydrogenase n=1 Tax=Allomuricauda sp. SCSIO 65647 TaxID=2908843 RepID=UPI001F388863|nr:menaquinone-dependent protoporphyrinogen IX dehydrogenase [Muricauda sp. SCSIO 65647]UJH66642.1 menaquinone-dependent protoporphyrinogen IX dehydrogenase [Muricauda sp. SCSIO 65647]
MKNRTLLLYSSVDGQTLKICNRLMDHLEQKNLVDLLAIDDFHGDISLYEKVIIGSSIRYGVHNKKMIDFINTKKAQLDSLKTAFFSVNLVARKPEKNTPDTNPYVIKFFKTIDWKPDLVTVFAGKLDYKKYPFFDRIMIQLIMLMTKGPTNTNAEIEYTDWKKVSEFGKQLNML